jgi:hypothetical protein
MSGGVRGGGSTPPPTRFYTTAQFRNAAWLVWFEVGGGTSSCGSSIGTVSAEPTSPESRDSGRFEVIHLGGEAAAIVPLGELRRLQALERHASPELLEEAEMETAFTEYRAWVAEGRLGAISHEEMTAELLGDSGAD